MKSYTEFVNESRIDEANKPNSSFSAIQAIMGAIVANKKMLVYKTLKNGEGIGSASSYANNEKTAMKLFNKKDFQTIKSSLDNGPYSLLACLTSFKSCDDFADAWEQYQSYMNKMAKNEAFDEDMEPPYSLIDWLAYEEGGIKCLTIFNDDFWNSTGKEMQKDPEIATHMKKQYHDYGFKNWWIGNAIEDMCKKFKITL